MLLKLSLITLLQLLTVSLTKSQLVEGDSCTVARVGSTGECRLLSRCKAAVDEIRNNQQYPARCGFTKTPPYREIVCCPVPPKKPSTPPPRPESVQRISEKKCLEYSELAYENFTVYPFIGDPIKIRRSICGFTSVPLIVGGTAAKPKEFPHMALLGYEKGDGIQWGCGGTLISDRYIVTAAHCLRASEFGDVKVARLGDLDWSSETDESSPIDMKIAEAIKHPDRVNTKYNDIGLLRLEEPVVFNEFIRPACLPTEFRIPVPKAIATGWGQVAWGDHTSNNLLKVTLDFFTHKQCNEDYEFEATDSRLGSGIIDATQVCAGSLDEDEEKDTCQGDSGGPLQIYHPDELHCMYMIVGVTSFGKACNGAAGVYTRVYAYLDWIERTVWPNE